ncbi:2-succinyl-5-enolpyruvyl-6-hydroxy-3-cyclohexene-1-carboxylic-acid synthase [Dermatobacter hominis]|uniref:2-succinyl-5-enolpyruvyl-6-hydroxy-3- cyclohexene-1-carboxylic-acid synthase n=1 Tax=Dermatobacter hominis TaxID=2884263 RepID=UPI001D117652|nr:2-succinyl-5-enolpyruvyl-6-hydroxy-3-cyclohexene-1-carboxylic-acid synthase [Dermatobacter hominis]UDY36008.1 2-succinyl-5-enolpyruvyl-6-hydroxy-3-cyclohexene-1-carboxylic-acid synthase [Dermatobacter hominis]
MTERAFPTEPPAAGAPTAPGAPDAAPDAPPADPADVAATYCATLVDEWRRLGLTDAVVSPGSRSTPLAVAIAEQPGLRVHVVHDERSAAFTALGLGIASGRPAVLLCTSGTAAANFHPAVVEAHQAAVPVLVVTADRPPELQGVGAPQTIDQRDLYGSAVRWYCEPGPAAAEGSAWWRDLARDSWVRTLGTTPGPVHLDLAFREPLLGTPGPLPPAREPLPAPTPGASWGVVDEELGRLVGALSGRRGMVVAGARAAVDEPDAEAVLGLAERLGWPVLADAPSGCRRGHPSVVTTADLLLRHGPFADAHRPEFVLRLGGLHASRVLNEWLARSGAVQVGVDRFGLVPDPDHLLARALPADPAEVCRQLGAGTAAPAPEAWTTAWRAAETTARGALDEVLGAGGTASEPATALDALAAVPPGGVLVTSSSMPVRDLEWFAPACDDVRVVANRGANGIDGVTSTAVGVALTWTPTVLLTGDIAFLHDSSALIGLARRGVNLAIVVVDNDGGGIFSFLPQAERLAEERFEQLFGTPHGIDVVAVAEAHGVPAERVTSRAGLQAALSGAAMRGGPRVIAVRSDRTENVAVHRRLQDAVAAALARAAGTADEGPAQVERADGSGNVES